MRNKLAANLLAYCLAATVIAAGMLIPNALLNEQENKIFIRQSYQIQDKELLAEATAPPAAIRILSPDEILYRTEAWGPGGQTTLRERYSDEISMDAAAEYAKATISQLVKNSVLPRGIERNLKLSHAELFWSANDMGEDDYALWDLRFQNVDEDYYVNLLLDSKTGCVLGITAACRKDHSDNTVTPETMLRGYSDYLTMPETGDIIEENSQFLTMNLSNRGVEAIASVSVVQDPALKTYVEYMLIVGKQPDIKLGA